MAKYNITIEDYLGSGLLAGLGDLDFDNFETVTSKYQHQCQDRYESEFLRPHKKCSDSFRFELFNDRVRLADILRRGMDNSTDNYCINLEVDKEITVMTCILKPDNSKFS